MARGATGLRAPWLSCRRRRATQLHRSLSRKSTTVACGGPWIGSRRIPVIRWPAQRGCRPIEIAIVCGFPSFVRRKLDLLSLARAFVGRGEIDLPQVAGVGREGQFQDIRRTSRERERRRVELRIFAHDGQLHPVAALLDPQHAGRRDPAAEALGGNRTTIPQAARRAARFRANDSPCTVARGRGGIDAPKQPRAAPEANRRAAFDACAAGIEETQAAGSFIEEIDPMAGARARGPNRPAAIRWAQTQPSRIAAARVAPWAA